MKKLLYIFIILTILFSIALADDAQATQTSETVETTEVPVFEFSPTTRLADVCPQLSDPDSYPENQRWQRVITEADNGILLRTSDFRTDFSSVDFAPLVKSLKAQGVTLVVAQLPPRALVLQDFFLAGTAPVGYSVSEAEKGYVGFVGEARAAGALAPNLYEEILRTNTQASYYLARDNHWDYHGVKLTAQSIAELLKTEGFEFTPQNYSTNEGFKLNIDGEHAKTVNKLCNINLPLMKSIEPITDVVKDPETESTTDDSTSTASEATSLSLFGDKTIDVVLVGTSFSHEVRNFHGYLKEAMSTDVLVYQVQGQGVYTPFVEYLSSSSFQENKRKVIIWEIPANFPVTAKKGMDQIVTAANSSTCQTSDKVATTLLEAGQKQFTLLNRELDIPQNGYSLIRIDLPKPPKDISVKLVHANGESVPYRMKRTHLSDSTHQLYLPITKEYGTLTKVELTTQTALTEDFNADLYVCQSNYL